MIGIPKWEMWERPLYIYIRKLFFEVRKTGLALGWGFLYSYNNGTLSAQSDLKEEAF